LPAEAARLRIGTRGSPLALAQAKGVAARLRDLGRPTELVIIKTSGDLPSRGRLPAAGRHDAPPEAGDDKGLFVRELEQALLRGEIELAVHSLKDLPTELPEGLLIAAVPPRETPLDALCSRGKLGLEELPVGARVGTSSLRRRAQLLAARPDLRIEELRGNLDTRLRRLEEGRFDAIVVAAAGLRRLGLEQHTARLLPPEVCLPACGQGALGLEATIDDASTRELVAQLDDPPSHQAILAERAFLRRLGGGCRVPIAALGIAEGDELWLRGAVISPDGRQQAREELRGSVRRPELLGRQLAERLVERGARQLLKAVTA
jgi:hydroxymethylbilane synthase